MPADGFHHKTALSCSAKRAEQGAEIGRVESHGHRGESAIVDVLAERKLVLSLGGLFAWLLCLPMFGPSLSIVSNMVGVSPLALVGAFLPAHAVSLLAIGYSGAAQNQRAPSVYSAAILLCAVISLVLPFSGPLLSQVLMCALGAIAAYPVIFLCIYVARSLSASPRAKTLGVTMAFANVFLYAVNLAVSRFTSSPPFIWVLGPSLLLCLPLIYRPRLPVGVTAHTHVSAVPSEYRWRLAYLIFVFYLVAGLSYQLVYPQDDGTSIPFLISMVGVLPYITGVIAVGVMIATPVSINRLISLTVAVMGSSLSFYRMAYQPVAYMGAHVLIQVGYALADMFLWNFLADTSVYPREGARFGLGLSMNVGAIMLGLAVTEHVLPLVELTRDTAALVGVIGLFLAVPIWSQVSWPTVDRDSAEKTASSRDDVVRTFQLTKRQEEICRMLLHGMSSESIIAELHISENTLKTHLRNIYAKTGTENRKDLMIRVMSSLDKGADDSQLPPIA